MRPDSPEMHSACHPPPQNSPPLHLQHQRHQQLRESPEQLDQELDVILKDAWDYYDHCAEESLKLNIDLLDSVLPILSRPQPLLRTKESIINEDSSIQHHPTGGNLLKEKMNPFGKAQGEVISGGGMVGDDAGYESVDGVEVCLGGGEVEEDDPPGSHTHLPPPAPRTPLVDSTSPLPRVNDDMSSSSVLKRKTISTTEPSSQPKLSPSETTNGVSAEQPKKKKPSDPRLKLRLPFSHIHTHNHSPVTKENENGKRANEKART